MFTIPYERLEHIILKIYLAIDKPSAYKKCQSLNEFNKIFKVSSLLRIVGIPLLLCLLISLLATTNTLPVNVTKIIISIGLITLCGIYTVSDLNKDELFIIVFTLHCCLPKKRYRENIILSSINKKREINKQQRYIINQVKVDIKKFCINHFKIQSSGFINFYQKRSMLNGEPCTSFILYSVNIPKKDRLGPDRLRKILLNFTPVKEYCPEINFAFSNYSENEIEEVFTNHQGKYFFNTLIEQTNNSPKVLPIYNSFYEMEQIEGVRRNRISKKLQELDNKQIKNFKFNILITNEDYKQASCAFNNCINKYTQDFETIFIRVSYLDQNYACIAIVDNKIDEIKGVSNRELSNSLLIKIINQFL